MHVEDGRWVGSIVEIDSGGVILACRTFKDNSR